MDSLRLERELFRNESLDKYTYTRVGGRGRFVAFPNTQDQVRDLILWAKEQQLAFLILGNGSNVIIKDSGFNGLVIFTTKLTKFEAGDCFLRAEVGIGLKELSQKALELGLTGLEFACGIPGTLGGGVFMNAGAYGGELKDVVRRVKTVDQEGNFRVYQGGECGFTYRNSIFQMNGESILEVEIELAKASKNKIKENMDHLTELRASKQPLEYPSCGSVFKRPRGYFVGKLISEANLQGFQIGGVQISTKHAGFMVNVDQGTAEDYLQLIKHVQRVIKDIYGIDLETEVRIIG